MRASHQEPFQASTGRGESYLTPAMTRLIHLHARIRNTPSAHRPKHRPRIPLMTYPETFLRHRDIPVVQALGVFPQAGSRKQEKWMLT